MPNNPFWGEEIILQEGWPIYFDGMLEDVQWETIETKKSDPYLWGEKMAEHDPDKLLRVYYTEGEHALWYSAGYLALIRARNDSNIIDCQTRDCDTCDACRPDGQ